MWSKAKLSICGVLVLLAVGVAFTVDNPVPLAAYAAGKTPHPGWQLIFNGTLRMDETWIAQNPDADHVHQEVSIPGPGYLYTYDYYNCYRLDDPQGWCAYKGGYTFTLYNSQGESKNFWDWVDGGVAHLDVWECLSSNLDVYPYACDIEVYWEPDSDADLVPDHRDQCPYTSSGEPYDANGNGCPPATQPPPTVEAAVCELELYISPEQLGPGETAFLDFRAFRDGVPLAGETARVDVLSGPGVVLDGPYLTDEYGEATFIYQAPSDIPSAETVQFMGTVSGCPDDAATTMGYLHPLTPPTATARPSPVASPVPTATALPQGSLDLVVAETNSAGQPYTAIAADEVSTLRLEAHVSGSLTPDDVQWEVTSTQVDDPGYLEVAYTGKPGVSTRDFLPSFLFPAPFWVRVTASAQTASGVVSDSVDIQVVRPPVILIHGIWSNQGAMTPVQAYLMRTGQFRVYAVDYGTPPKKSEQDMRISVRYLAEGVERALGEFRSQGIKVSRVDVVAHSMGGVIARLFIVGDGQSVSAHPDVVRKLITLSTPHGGSIVADWYTDLMDNGSVDCYDASGYVPEKVTRNEIRWFMDFVRARADMSADALAFGEAVRQLQTRGQPGSIIDVLYSRHLQVDEKTEYHVYYGITPLGGVVKASLAYDYARLKYAFWSGNLCGEGWRPAVENMIKDFLVMVTMEKSDGVVSGESLRAEGVGIRSRDVLAYYSNHFDIVKNGYVHSAILSTLTYGQVRQAIGSFIVSYSPGTLHVYTSDGRHVGVTSDGRVDIGIEGAFYQAFRDTMGVHEVIWVPGDLDLDIWFEANAEGVAGVDISRSAADDLYWYAYKDIEVQPGDRIGVHLEDIGVTGRLDKADGESVAITPSYTAVGVPKGGAEPLGGYEPLWSLLVLSLCCLVVVLGGAAGTWFLSRQRPVPRWRLGCLLALAAGLLVLICVLGSTLSAAGFN